MFTCMSFMAFGSGSCRKPHFPGPSPLTAGVPAAITVLSSPSYYYLYYCHGFMRVSIGFYEVCTVL